MNSLDIAWKTVSKGSKEIQLINAIDLIEEIDNQLGKRTLSQEYQNFLIEFCINHKYEKITKDEFKELFEKLFQFSIDDVVNQDTAQFQDPTESIKLETTKINQYNDNLNLNDQYERIAALKDILLKRKQSNTYGSRADLSLELLINEKLVGNYESLLDAFKNNDDNNIKLVDLEKMITSQEGLIDKLSNNLNKNKKQHKITVWGWVKFVLMFLLSFMVLSYVLSFYDELPRTSRSDYNFVDNAIIDVYELLGFY